METRKTSKATDSQVAMMMFSLLFAVLQGQAVPPRVTLEHKLNTDDMEIGLIADGDLAPDGSVYLLDQSNRRIYRFNAAGGLVDSLGRKGKGPGEFEMAAQLETGPAGQVAIADIANRRLTIWTADGRLESTTPMTDMAADMSWSAAGLYYRSISWEGTGEQQLHRQSSPGQFTLRARFRGAGCDFCDATIGGRGEIFIVAPDTIYAVAQLDSLGQPVRTLSRPGVSLVRWSEAELSDMEFQARRRGIPWDPAAFRFKRPLMANSIAVDGSGRVWLRPTVASGAGSVLDVFGRDGRFLGSVRLGQSLQGFAMRGNRIVGWGEDGDGVPAAWVYRVE